MSNVVQPTEAYDISIQRSDESDFDEDEYWHSVDQERLKEEYWHSVEQERLKEDYKNIYENLKEEYGANMSNEEHDFIMDTTLSIIKELEIEQETELDDESFKKMICNIYPEVCESYFEGFRCLVLRGLKKTLVLLPFRRL